MDVIKNSIRWIRQSRLRFTFTVLILIVVGYLGVKQLTPNQMAAQYQTSSVEKGTIVSTISASGQINTSNIVSINSDATGVVKDVFVKDGDTVSAGQTIAVISLDTVGLQKNSAAWASYLSSKNSVDTATTTLFTLQADLFAKWKTYTDLAQSSDYDSPQERSLPAFIIAQDNWLAAEAKYKQQQSVIDQTRASLGSAWYTYQATAPIITAPIAGIVTNIGLVPGIVLSSTSSSSNSNQVATGQRIAVIQNQGVPLVSVSLTEVDVPKVVLGQKVTVTVDSLPDKTFTGKVATVDRIGATSSNVTSYASIIALDSGSDELLPNMAATANIILDTKTDVLVVPVGAVQIQGDTASVRVLQNGKEQDREVQVGISSDTQTEIISGLSEGEQVITGTSQTSVGTQRTGSVFGGLGGGAFRGFGGGAGGGQVRIQAR